MSYFQLYEKKRNRYKSITPGSVWVSETGTYTVVILSVNLSDRRIEGIWNSVTFKDSITWLLSNYHLVEE
jgi:hypothetical protein